MQQLGTELTVGYVDQILGLLRMLALSALPLDVVGTVLDIVALLLDHGVVGTGSCLWLASRVLGRLCEDYAEEMGRQGDAFCGSSKCVPAGRVPSGSGASSPSLSP